MKGIKPKKLPSRMMIGGVMHELALWYVEEAAADGTPHRLRLAQGHEEIGDVVPEEKRTGATFQLMWTPSKWLKKAN